MAHEMYLDDLVDPIDEEGVHLRTCVVNGEDGPYAKTKTIATVLKNEPYEGTISLGAHVRNEEDMIVIIRSYAPYLDRIHSIVWDIKSRRGIRSDVRFNGFPAMRRLYSKRAIELDDDLECQMIFDENMPGNRKTVRTGKEAIKNLFDGLDKACEQRKWLYSTREGSAWFKKDYEWPKESLIRSGCFCYDFELMDEKEGVGYNPFLGVYLIVMKTNEDMVMSEKELIKGNLLLHGHTSWIGDRVSNEEISYPTFLCMIAQLLEMNHKIAVQSNRRKLTGNTFGTTDPIKLEAQGVFEPVKIVVKEMKVEKGRDRLPFHKNYPEVIHRLEQRSDGVALLEALSGS